MNLPPIKDLHAYIDTLLGPEYRDHLRTLATPMRPLAECSPQPWDTTPREYEDISHDCA